MPYGKNCNLRTLRQSREYDCLAKIGTKEAFTLLLGKLGQTSKGSMRRLELTIKDKNIWKNTHTKILTFCCGVLAVIGRHGPHLISDLVMLFVTQNDF